MSKSPSKLQQARDLAKLAIDKANQRIIVLGEYDEDMSNTLADIQYLFDKIRNVPTGTKKQYDKIKQARLNWLSQAKLIEEKYSTAAQNSIKSGAAGAVAGIGVVALGPTFAMGVATTFGVASTGTAISALSGAAATNAALAWLGGGAIAVGGGGMAAGEAFLTLAGPIGWAIAAIALIGSGIFFLISKNQKNRLENIFTLISERDVKSYELAIVELNERIKRIKSEMISIREAIGEIKTFGTDYNNMKEEQQLKLGSYVNLMNASTQLLTEPILGLQPKYTEEDYNSAVPELLNDLQKTLISLENCPEKTRKEIFANAKDRYKKCKLLSVSLANLLYKIELDDKDCKVLAKSIRGNKEFLKTVKVEKSDINAAAVQESIKLLKKKYETNE